MEISKQRRIKLSHTSQVQCKIQSINAVKKACDTMGLTFQEGGTYRVYGGANNAEYVIKLKNSPYDLGLVKQPDGTYDIKCDFWGTHVAKEVGENCGLILQETAAQAAIEAAQMRGVSIYRTYDYEREEIVLELEEPEELQAYQF